MKQLLKPGVRFMRNYRTPVKFALVSVAFLIPLIVATSSLMSGFRESKNFSEKELVGLDYAEHFFPIQRSLEDFRMYAIARASGANVGDLPNQSATVLESNLNEIMRHVNEHGDEFGLKADMEKFQKNWRDFSSNPGKSLTEIRKNSADLRTGMSALIFQLFERSNLALDPDADSYWLISGLLANKDLSQALAMVRVHSYTSGGKPMSDMQQARSLIEALTNSKAYAENLEQNLQRAVAANPTVEKKLPMEALGSAQSFLNLAEAQLLNQSAPVDLTRLWNAGSQAMAEVEKLALAQIVTTSALIETRVDGLRQRQNIVVAVTLIFLLIAAYLMICFYLSSMHGFGFLEQRISAMAEGDLRIDDKAKGRDEVGQSLRRLLQGMGSLANMVSGIRSSAEAINVAGEQITAGNADLSARGEKQAAVVEQTTASMAQIAEAVKRNLHSAQQADQLAHSAFDVAKQGGEVVSQAVGRMDSITESSKRIGDIIGVIDGIAFQTNILALNAAVEAARAGEQGRGFAVVASEVRSLAQRSAAAAKEIKDLIGASIETVDSGAVLVKKAGATMQEIVASVGRVTDIMQEISAASREQDNEIEQLRLAMNEIDQTTQQNAALVEQTAAASMSLREQANALVTMVGTFKVSR